VTDRRAKAIAAEAGGSVTDPDDGRKYEVVKKDDDKQRFNQSTH